MGFRQFQHSLLNNLSLFGACFMVDRIFFLEWAFFVIPVTKYILREYEFVPEKVVTTTVY